MGKISQNLSSDSLFHFIRQRDWLIEIIQKKAFQARFVYEELPALKQKLGIPMKCFFDIPLGQIKRHMSVYGKYGIGVTKRFARRCSLSPIIYIHDKSDTVNRYLSNVKNIKRLNAESSLVPYFKLEEGKVTSNGREVKRRFYDEREWRYVPNNAELIDFGGFDELEIRKTRLDFENNSLIEDTGKYLLPLQYDDITYLIVETAKDVYPLIKALKSLDIEKRSIELLISKIITARQIEHDF